MKKLMLLCLVFVFAFAVQGEKKDIAVQTPQQIANAPDDANPPVNPIIQQMLRARKNGDWNLHRKLLELYTSQMPIPETSIDGPQVIKPEDHPIIRWNGDQIIFSGDVAYNEWAYDDEAFSVDLVRGDTVRAAVATADSLLNIYQSDNGGVDWYFLMGWNWGGNAVYEPEIINDPDGIVYHVASRWSQNNGDIYVFTDSLTGGWYYRSVGVTADTVRNYTMCSDRAVYGGGYYLFLMYQKALGGQGLDEIWFARSFDEADNWETAVSLQFSGSVQPDITFGDNDYLYQSRMWDNANDSDYVRIRVSTDEGDSWGSSITVQTDTLPKMTPQIAAAHDGSGDLWLTWPRIWVNNADDWDLYYSWSQNNGASWSTPNFVSGAGYWEEITPSIAIYDSSSYYVAHLSWLECDTVMANRSVRTSYWDTSDSSWATEETYNDYTPGLLRPCQTFEYPGSPAIAYAGDYGANVYYDSWSMATGVEEGYAATSPSKVYMQNRPNPFRTATLLEYNVPVSGKVSLKIYNALGQEVAKLVDEYKSAGTYTFNWNGLDKQHLALSKGVYFAKLQVGTTNATRKIIVQ